MFACNICQRSGFSSSHSVNQHKYSFHPKEKQLANKISKNNVVRVVCPFCEEVFDTLEQLKQHFKVCFYDMEDIDLPPEIIQELKTDRNPADKYLCGVCTESARTLEELAYHNYDSHPTCLKCGMSWKKTQEYELHAIGCKEDFDPIKLKKKNESECPICRKVEYNLYQLKRHLENEHYIRKRSYY